MLIGRPMESSDCVLIVALQPSSTAVEQPESIANVAINAKK
jgi:hypothetical protein